MATILSIRPQVGLRLQKAATPAESRDVARPIYAPREMALSASLRGEDLERFESVKFASRVVRQGDHVFNAGDKFSCLYSIRGGCFKTSLPGSQGREQVTGFFMSGDLFGLDGLGGARYNVTAVALEDSTVWIMPYAVITALAREVPSLQCSLDSELSRELARSYGVMTLLGSTSAQERVAGFLLNLSRRHLRRGLSGSSFTLGMTRADIGNYLGITLETVSRTFSAFQAAGLIKVQQRALSILDVEGLERILETVRPKRGARAGCS